jgi:glycosyltransferase involved in cell wall biosynthesis
MDTTRFTPTGLKAPRTSRLRIVTVGRIVARKGVATVIEALAQLPSHLAPELVIAGGPAPDHLDDDPDVTALRLLASRLNVVDDVHFQGRIPHDHIPELLRSADVFACAPHYEPFGTAALEAAACGVPVVAAKVGGLAEHIRHNVTGILVPSGATDPAAFAAGLTTLLDDQRLRTAMGRAAAEHAQQYSWPTITTRILSTYRSALRDGPSSHALEQGTSSH